MLASVPLSVVINTKNAAATLERALSSVKWAREIIVVDMQSTDETLAIAQKFTQKIYHHEDVGYADPARNFALSKATQDWILVLDADEEVPDSLVEPITKVVTTNDQHAACYLLPRKNIIFGHWMQHTGWWPDYQPRLFRAGTVSWEVGVHRLPDIVGSSQKFPEQESHALVHHNYASVSEYIERLNRYTHHQSRERMPADFPPLTSAAIISTVEAELLRRLFAQRGIADGPHGVSLSFLQSTYELVVLLKQWELQGFPSQEGDLKTQEMQAVTGLDHFRRNLHYWIATWHVENSSGLRRLYWRARRKWHI